jgi:ribosomal protein S1
MSMTDDLETTVKKENGENTETGHEEEMSMDKLLAEQDKLCEKLYDKDIVKVKVVQITNKNILVDIGEKKEGLIPKLEFEQGIPQIGEEISAILVRKSTEKTHPVLSHKRALEKKGLDLCKKAREEKNRVKGIIRETIKGGYIVETFGVRGFMPLSLSELHPTYKHHLPIGAKIRCQIIELSTSKRRMIISRKQILTEDEQKRRDKVLSDVKRGDILRVVVSKVGKDKLFLRFQGIEAIVDLENVAWRYPEKVIKNFKRGQRIRAKLLRLDKEKYKLETGLKQLYPNPADVLRRKYPVKSVVKGKVIKITDDGMEVAVSSRTNGFVPSSEFGHELGAKEGKNISCVVTGINTKDYTLKLSVKRFEILQNKRIVAKYLRKPPPLTLRQLLTKAETEKEEKQTTEE